jgi:Zn-finger nucleic acid-binding protein
MAELLKCSECQGFWFEKEQFGKVKQLGFSGLMANTPPETDSAPSPESSCGESKPPPDESGSSLEESRTHGKIFALFLKLLRMQNWRFNSNDESELSADESELSVDESELSVDESESSVDESESSVDESESSVDESESSVDESESSVDESEFSSDESESSVDKPELSSDEQEYMCPACEEPLVTFMYAYSSDITLHRCPRCRGIWAYSADLLRIEGLLAGYKESLEEAKFKALPLMLNVKEQVKQEEHARKQKRKRKKKRGLLNSLSGPKQSNNRTLQNILEEFEKEKKKNF